MTFRRARKDELIRHATFTATAKVLPNSYQVMMEPTDVLSHLHERVSTSARSLVPAVKTASAPWNGSGNEEAVEM